MQERPSKPEVLAPAGSPAALAAALANGADAVYFGLQDGFNARARAENFTLERLPEITAQIHRAGARAYLTLNTLVFEPELPAVERLLRAVAASGVDALIVQDPAVCLLARAICPDLELHASTQMTIAQPAAVAFARSLGVTRVVVPRELSVAEIERFAAATDVELEVFIHGALCVSWSGQCLTSEAWGGRSANRGQCAQSCRMPYDLIVDGERRDLGDVRYLLSPLDLAGVRAVPDLLRIGVHGLKIEGRQKGPQYVATATAGYRRWVDALAAGSDRAAAERQLQRDLLSMALSYTRGFSDGFLAGSDHQALVEGRFPKHRGVYVGRVVGVHGDTVVVRRDGAGRPWTGALGAEPAERAPARAAGPQGARSSPLTGSLDAAPLVVHAGMGVVFDQGDPEDPSEPGGPIFAVSEHGDELRLRFGSPGPDLGRVRRGDRVFVTSDGVLAAKVERDNHRLPTGRIAVDLRVSGAAGEPLRIEARCRQHVVAVASPGPLQPARGAGLDAALLAEKLGGFGGTPFHLGGLDIDGLGPGLHLPPGELKELRRQLVAALEPAIERGPLRVVDPTPALPRLRVAAARPEDPTGSPATTLLVPLVREQAQLEAVIALGLPEVELDWMEFAGLSRAVQRARTAGLRVVLATTRVGKPGEERLDQHLLDLAPDGLLLRHWGAVTTARAARERGQRLSLHGDFSLNVTNSVTAHHLLSLGLDTLTPSFDLDEAQLLALLEHVPAARVSVVLQHRIPTFHTEHCVYSHLLSNGRDFRSCGRPCERHRVALRDHLGREHPVLVDVGCRNTVFHHEPQHGAAVVRRLSAVRVQRCRVEFVRESAVEVQQVLEAAQQLLAGRIDAAAYGRRARAADQIGVALGGMRLLAE